VILIYKVHSEGSQCFSILPSFADDVSKMEGEAGTTSREQIIQLNNDIAMHAKRKELGEAMALFHSAIEKGSANSHTYAAAINANIRCGRIDGAENVFELMKKKGRKPDVIICTTMMKGYCSIGRVDRAMSVLDDMTNKKPIITPNIRTINTLLRGCVQIGDVTTAETLIAKAQKDFKIPLDVSSWESLVNLLTQSLKLDKALPVIGRLKDEAAFQSGIVGMHVNIARAAAVLGEWKTCRKSLNTALAILDGGNKSGTSSSNGAAIVAGSSSGAGTGAGAGGDAAMSSAVTTALGAFQQALATGDADAIIDTAAAPAAPAAAGSAQRAAKTSVTGGKKAWNSEDVDARRAESLELYQEHNKAELRAEIKVISAFVEKASATKSVTPLQYIFPFYLQIFPFASNASSDAPVLRKELVKPIMKTIEDHFGLDSFARRVASKSCDDLNGYSLISAAAAAEAAAASAAAAAAKEKKKSKKNKTKQTTASEEPGAVNNSGDAPPLSAAATAAAAAAGATAAAAVKMAETNPDLKDILSFRALTAKAFESSGKFAFKSLFSRAVSRDASDNKSSNASKDLDVPLKMEVCSGAGEWAVAQVHHLPQLLLVTCFYFFFYLISFVFVETM
jgi:pentatricopeptide repeat protein